MNPFYSFIILTYNEEIHLPRLLASIAPLNAQTYILDSGSSDNTHAIAKEYGAHIKINTFENHPKQWHYALNNFDVTTPWIIGLDADQKISPELEKLLTDFTDDQFKEVNGIYFNRKNFFQGEWLKHGGYFPFYMLKMFRRGIGYSDLNENMDHRFVVSGNTLVWENGFLEEENLKENDTSFWIEKHKKYSDLVAAEEYDRMFNDRGQTLVPKLLGNPDQRRAWFKKLWWQLPLGIRPYLYFIYRYFFKLGILDGPNGRKFHYLHALWFRKLVDKKLKALIEERNERNRIKSSKK